MRGHEYARSVVLSRLVEVLPTRLEGIRTALEVDTPLDPPEAAYLLADSLPTDPNLYPCVVVMSTSAPTFKRQSVMADGDSADYIVHYSISVVVACRVDEAGAEPQASIDRDRLMLAVRESLMTRTDMPEDIDLDISSITEETGASAQDLRGRPLAAGQITLRVVAIETFAPLPAPDVIVGVDGSTTEAEGIGEFDVNQPYGGSQTYTGYTGGNP